MTSIQRIFLSALGLCTIAAANEQVPLGLDGYACTHPPYQVLMVSKSPLVLYLPNFITPTERAHLLRVSSSSFSPSSITHHNPSSRNALRTSSSTTPPRDAIIRCIESRALSFQGHLYPPSHLEPLQLVKYAPTEHYHFHTDWFTSPEYTTPQMGGNRVSSFFAYIHVANDTTGGGTNFPHLNAEALQDERWCTEGRVDCDEEWERGVTFRPVEGNAIYWENLLPDGSGRGDERTLHAGLPVTGGGKVGMNIWTREGPLGRGIKGEDV